VWLLFFKSSLSSGVNLWVLEKDKCVLTHSGRNFAMDCSLDCESFFIVDKSPSLESERGSVEKWHEVSLKVDSRPC
jgi:hypothetical protein